jgi:hypothetical protein
VYWHITAAGSAEVADWLSSPVVRSVATRDELAVKIAVAATLPGVDVAEVIESQRAVSAHRRAALRDATFAGTDDAPEALAWSLIIDSMRFAAEAEERWLDHVEQRLAAHPVHALALELATERPKRGRPAKDAAA